MSFTISFNSKNGLYTDFYSDLVNYNFNWDETPEHEGGYKVTWNFLTAICGSGQGGGTQYSPLYLCADWGGNSNNFATIYPSVGAPLFPNGRVLGVVKAKNASLDASAFFLGANTNDNPSIILNCKPSNNNVTIRIFNAAWARGLSIQNNPYILTIYFEAI